MPKIKHIATGPNGETFKRVSASRTYSHCIIGRPSLDCALRRAQQDMARHGRDFDYYSRSADGTYEFPSFYTDQARAKAQAEGQAWIAENGNDRAAYVERKSAEDLAHVEENRAAGLYDRFQAVGWASRLDLAQKAAAAAMTGGYYAETRFVEAKAS